MLRRVLMSLMACACLLSPVRAAAAPVDLLAEALHLSDLFRVMADEGRDYGADLEAELFPQAGGTRWAETVAAIHAPERIEALVMAQLATELARDPDAVARMTTFFTTTPGARIAKLEIAAREAYLDEATKEAAEAAFMDMLAASEPRLETIRRLAEVNDLIEQNVAGALNANLAFYRGMVAGGAVQQTLPDSEMMADLWSQEAQIRKDTTDWLMPYMALAYRPLSDADLDAYIAFSETADGQLLNQALFAAFNRMFNAVSRDLGVAAAKMLQGQDI